MKNLVYINTHDSGRVLSPYGYPTPTSNLSAFADEATLFTHCYCCGPTCSPSRAAMLTGEYPHQNGMLGLAQRGFDLVEPSHHLANYLRSHGYTTAISGIQHEKGWYLDIDKDELNHLGYDVVLTNDTSRYPDKKQLHHWDHENAISAVDWLNHVDKTKPFMLSFGLHSTHRPFPDVEDDINVNQTAVLPPFDSNATTRMDQAMYNTSAKHADVEIGLIIDALKQNGLYDNTVVMYTTDHGEAVPFHKCFLSDQGIGVALIIRDPQKGHGEVYDHLISHIDVFPTLCDLLGVEKPNYLQGQSYADVFGDTKIEKDEFIYAEVNFHTSYEPIRCVRNNRFKYVKYFDDYDHYNLSNMDESLTKTVYMNVDLKNRIKPMEALYDTWYDRGEVNNVIDDPQYHDVVETLRNALHEHMVKTNDPLLDGEIEVKPNYKVNKRECEQASSKNPDDYDPRGRH